MHVFSFSRSVLYNNRWNSVSQDEVDVTSVNLFKSRLEKRRSHQMDFFKDL